MKGFLVEMGWAAVLTAGFLTTVLLLHHLHLLDPVR